MGEDEIDRSEADEDVDDLGDDRAEVHHDVKAEEADEEPVEAADNDEGECDAMQCFHSDFYFLLIKGSMPISIAGMRMALMHS